MWLRFSVCLGLILMLLGCAGTAPLAPKAVDLNRAGSDALAAGDLQTAEARFALALEYHPRFVEALTNLGLVEMQRGNFARARVQLERARRINPDLAQPHHGLGVLAEREHRPDLAAEHYRDALKVNPGFGSSRANLGRLLYAAGQYDEAREQFLRLVEVDPGQLAGHTGLAETLLQLERFQESEQVVAKALGEFGDAPELLLLAARHLLRANKLDQAEQVLVPLTAKSDDIGRAAWAWLGACRLARGQLRPALDAANRAFALDRDDPLATYVVAMALREARDERAVRWLERAHLLAPQNSVVTAELKKARDEKTH
jgi:tetratricopeptide (TPR) repeat protein